MDSTKRWCHSGYLLHSSNIIQTVAIFLFSFTFYEAWKEPRMLEHDRFRKVLTKHNIFSASLWWFFIVAMHVGSLVTAWQSRLWVRTVHIGPNLRLWHHDSLMISTDSPWQSGPGFDIRIGPGVFLCGNL